jgi:outer membrane PBP1 activator LpoA protein
VVELQQDIAALLHINTEEDRKKMQDDNNKTTLEQQRRQDFDVVFLIAQPQVARQIVPLLKYYYVNNVPIIASSAIYTGSPDPQKDIDLNGVYFCDIPWVFKPRHGKNQQANRLYAVGIDSYTVSNNIPRLIQLPYFPIYGTTGALSLTAKQQIYRRLPWTQVHAGHV